MRSSLKIGMRAFGFLTLGALLVTGSPAGGQRRPLGERGASRPEVQKAPERVAAVRLDPVGSWGGGRVADLSVGWEFETADRVWVTALGVWNRQGLALGVDVPVAIWDDAGKVVVTTKVPGGDRPLALDDFRYESVEPVELAAGKRYVIAALLAPGPLNEVMGNGTSMTTAGPIRWVRPRRQRTDGLALPEARAEEGTAVGSFGPNFLVAASRATRKPGTFYRSRHLGWPPREQLVAVPERADGSHRDEHLLAVTLYADRQGKLTQVLMDDAPLGVGPRALDRIRAEMRRNAELAPELRPVIRIAAMDRVKQADREAVARLIDRDYLEPDAAGGAPDGITPLAKSRVRQPSRDGAFPDAGRFADHGVYVEDRWTGLLWQKDGLAAGKRNFYEAKEYAEKLELGGMRGWRVPDVEELRTIFPATFAPFTGTTYTARKCCAGPEEFAAYWTSQLDRGPDYAFVFQWYDQGGANNCTASANFVYVRCVHDTAAERD